MSRSNRLRRAALLFGLAAAASALALLTTIVRDGLSAQSTLFGLAAGTNALACALCHRDSRRSATTRAR